MLPIVAHVIVVDESLALAQFEIGEDDRMRIIGEGDPAVAINAIRLAMNAELMQVQVLPSHRDLEHVVQLGNRRVASACSEEVVGIAVRCTLLTAIVSTDADSFCQSRRGLLIMH